MEHEAGIEEFDLVGIEPTDMVEAGGLEAGPSILLQVRNTLNRMHAGEVLEIRTRDPDLKDNLGA